MLFRLLDDLYGKPEHFSHPEYAVRYFTQSKCLLQPSIGHVEYARSNISLSVRIKTNRQCPPNARSVSQPGILFA